MTLDVSMQDRARRERVSRAFFEGTGASYDRVVALTTLGLDRVWKRALMAAVPTDAGRVLDLASGTGIVLARLHARCPAAALVGVDFTADYLDVARRRFKDAPFDLTLVHSNAEDMELEGTFDAVVSSYIPKYVDPDVLLERLAAHVRPGTVLAVHDFARPRHGPGRFLWYGWMRLLRIAGPRIWPAWRTVFDENLEQLIAKSKWHRTYPDALARHGWSDVVVRPLTGRSAILVTARR